MTDDAVPAAPHLRLVPETVGASADTLLGRAASGDLAAFDALFVLLSPSVHGLALRLLRDRNLAEDVTQDVFVDVWRQAARFDASRGNARTWVLTIAHRRAVDVIRSREASKAREAKVSEPEEDVASPESSLVRAAERDSVRSCLDALTPLQRESVTLAYYGGLTYPQVAERLERPLPTVKTRMRDGLIRLRDCLEASHAL